MGLRLNSEIKPTELASLIVNLFIALYLQYYLAPLVSDLRIEKNLLIDDIKDLIAILKDLRESTDKNSESKQILHLFRRFSNGLDSFETALGVSQFQRLLADLEKVKDDYFNYKKRVTGGPSPSPVVGHHLQTDKAYSSLSLKLKSLIFTINKQR